MSWDRREEQLEAMLHIMAGSDDNGWQGDVLRLRSGQAPHPVFLVHAVKAATK